MNKIIISIILICSCLTAQKSIGGIPYSIDHRLPISSNKITFPLLDVNQLLDEDRNAPLAAPFRYGYKFDVDLSLENSGEWLNLENGDRLWRLTIKSQGAFALSLKKPFIAVNHLEGHALSPKLNSKLNYPYLLLLISGGHSQYLSVGGLGKYKRLGTTIDDALGEAFDKTAKLIGIEFPGGPQIEVYAKKGDPNKYELPKPIINRGGCNLSFAGLKTAVLKVAKKIKTDQEKYDLAASFQKTIEEILYKKSRIAFKEFKNIYGNKSNIFVVAGGVAANKKIREVLTSLSLEENFKPIFPPINLCGDNAAMVAMVGLEKFKLKQFNDLNHPARPRWSLDEDATFLKGAGIRL